MAKTPEIDLRDSLVGNNLIINGNMEISQRGSSFSAIANLAYSLDRWIYYKSGAAVHTVSKDTDVPTFTQSGQYFSNSIKLVLTTPDDSIAASDYCLFGQKIEGYNFNKVAQKPFTLSFWVKANTVGTYHISAKNSASDRTIHKAFTIVAPATWEKKTITFPASPSGGAWDSTNGVGLSVYFVLAAGTDYHGTSDIWQTPNKTAGATQVNGVATGSTNFNVTGVMLNEGSEALPFSLAGNNNANELQLCQRYYCKGDGDNVTPGTAGLGQKPFLFLAITAAELWGNLDFPVSMRTTPTVQFWDNANNLGKVHRIGVGNHTAVTSMGRINQNGFSQIVTSGLITASPLNIYGGAWAADAELF